MTARRNVVGVVVLAVIVGAVLWFFGLGVVPALGVTGAIVAVGLVWLGARDGESLAWPTPPVRFAAGARRDVQEIAWALRSRGGVPERLLVRVRDVARRRLRAAHRLDLDDPGDQDAIARLLPPDVLAVLRSPRRPELTLASYSALLAAVERLPTERHP
jgi:hypothetical protein